MFCKLGKLIGKNRMTDGGVPNDLVPWIQELKPPESRYLYGQYSEFDAIKHLRDTELLNPAPFSNRSLIEIHNHSTSRYKCPVDVALYQSNTLTFYKMDVPVMNIIGAGTTANMHNFTSGKTYRDVLFTCLHGAGLGMDALDFLTGDSCKDDEMPHTRIEHDRKTRSKGALTLTRYGNYFFTSHGHQRTVLAMYAIWRSGR